MMNLGDVPAGSVLYVPFATYNSAGASVTISGLAVTDIEIYKNGSTTQRASDAGYTLLDTDGIDFDGITGIHGFSIDLADNTDSGFYAAGAAYFLVVSAITVDSQTVNFVYYFTIDRANVLRPTTAGRTLDVASTGEAGIDFGNVLLPVGAIPALGWIDNGDSQGGGTASNFIARSGLSLADDVAQGVTIGIYAGTGIGQSRLASANVGSSDTFTVTPDWEVTPDNTSKYWIAQTAPSSGGSGPTADEIADEVQTRTIAAVTLVNGLADGTITAAKIASDAITAAKIATDAIAGAKVASDAVTKIQTGLATPTNITAGTITTVTNLTNAPTSGDLTATMKTSIGTAVAASAVASVTGNVGGNVAGSVGSVTGNVGGNVTGSVGSLATQAKADVNAEVDSAISDAALATASALATTDGKVDDIKAVADKVNDTLEDDGGTYRFTTNALEQGPTGGGDSAATIASAVRSELTTELGRIDADISSRASQASVDDLNDLDATEVQTAAGAALTAYDPPTNAEMEARTLAAASYATAAGQTPGAQYKKNVAASNIPFVLVDSTDHVTRETGITPTATRSIDGAAFEAVTGTITEIGNGAYGFDASQADMNGDNIVFRFAGTGCDPVELHIKTYT